MKGRKSQVEGTASAKALRWELTKAKIGQWRLGEICS